jgi:hypothetical protein
MKNTVTKPNKNDDNNNNNTKKKEPIGLSIISNCKQ